VDPSNTIRSSPCSGLPFTVMSRVLYKRNRVSCRVMFHSTTYTMQSYSYLLTCLSPVDLLPTLFPVILNLSVFPYISVRYTVWTCLSYTSILLEMTDIRVTRNLITNWPLSPTNLSWWTLSAFAPFFLFLSSTSSQLIHSFLSFFWILTTTTRIRSVRGFVCLLFDPLQ
jgi:hypothetical protein